MQVLENGRIYTSFKHIEKSYIKILIILLVNLNKMKWEFDFSLIYEIIWMKYTKYEQLIQCNQKNLGCNFIIKRLVDVIFNLY